MTVAETDDVDIKETAFDLKSIDKNIRKLIKKNPGLEYVPEIKKIRCQFSKHEMPLREDIIIQYTGSKKYQKYLADAAFDEYKEYIELHEEETTGKNRMYCKLTCRYFTRDLDQLLVHVEGKRFKAELQRYEDCKSKGVEYEPRSSRHKQMTQTKSKKKYKTKSGENADESNSEGSSGGEDEEESDEMNNDGSDSEHEGEEMDEDDAIEQSGEDENGVCEDEPEQEEKSDVEEEIEVPKKKRRKRE